MAENMHQDSARVAHSFINPRLSYEKTPNKQSYVRILTFFKKKPGISFDYFLNHWHHVHSDLVINMKSFKKNNIFHYTQFFQTSETREQGKALGYIDMEWDACSEFWVEKIEDYHGFINSQEYKDSFHDAEHFIDTNGGMRVMVGSPVLILGRAVPGFGDDGVDPKLL